MNSKFQLVYFFLFFLISLASSSNVCPFNYLYHFGDGVTDIGNSVLVLPAGNSLPPMFLPYGMTYPGAPNGRWSDGLIDIDFSAADFGFPNIAPYLSRTPIIPTNGVIFSVARSPVLDRQFFESRGIEIPNYVFSLSEQMGWFQTYLASICSTQQECATILANALVLLGDIEGNDIWYALSQGKSLKEAQSYVPYITGAQVEFIRELIKMGATRIIVPGNAPIGCYPYVLTARPTNDSSAYDDLGCLKDVNDLITFKNDDLQLAIHNLASEFPEIFFYYGAYGDGVIQVLNETSSGPNGDIALKSCCGIGGKYNYDSKRFCGDRGVPVCSNATEYIFWDGLHLTHEAALRIEQNLIGGALEALNCTTTSVASI